MVIKLGVFGVWRSLGEERSRKRFCGKGREKKGGHITFQSKDSVAKAERKKEVTLPSNQKILWQRQREKRRSHYLQIKRFCGKGREKKGGHITFKSKDSVAKAERKKEVTLPSNQKILWQRQREKRRSHYLQIKRFCGKGREKKGGHITFQSKDSVAKAERKKEVTLPSNQKILWQRQREKRRSHYLQIKRFCGKGREKKGGHITFQSKDSVAKAERKKEVTLPSNQKILWQRQREKRRSHYLQTKRFCGKGREKKGGHITFKPKDSVAKAEREKVILPSNQKILWQRQREKWSQEVILPSNQKILWQRKRRSYYLQIKRFCGKGREKKKRSSYYLQIKRFCGKGREKRRKKGRLNCLQIKKIRWWNHPVK